MEMPAPKEARVEVRSDADVIAARQKGREIADHLGFSATELTMIVTAISELARNIVRYAGHGEVRLKVERNHAASALVVVAADEGPAGVRAVVQSFIRFPLAGINLRWTKHGPISAAQANLGRGNRRCQFLEADAGAASKRAGSTDRRNRCVRIWPKPKLQSSRLLAAAEVKLACQLS